MSFTNSLDREIQRETSENKMFMNMLKTSIGVSVDKDEDIEENIVNATESVKNSLGQNRYSIRLYNSRGKQLYSDGLANGSISLSELGKKYTAFIIKREDDGQMYLEIMSTIKVYNKKFYVSSIRNIQYIYEDRDTIYSQYQLMLIGTLIVSVLLSYVLSRKITKPIVELSHTTQMMAAGDYSARTTRHEIGRASCRERV
nr:HAMP domain-containing protein [uncultured Eubacterium sp.]